jgi:hypothetical protein
MDISTREDIEAPIAFVFADLSDFAGFEKTALRRGAEVARTDSLAAPGPGMQWRATLPFRGKPRRMVMTLEDYAPPGHMRFEVEANNLTGELIVELVELSRRQTRLTVKVKLKPLSLTARVFVQSLRLAKTRVTDRMHSRIAQHAAGIAERYRTSAASR